MRLFPRQPGKKASLRLKLSAASIGYGSIVLGSMSGLCDYTAQLLEETESCTVHNEGPICSSP